MSGRAVMAEAAGIKPLRRGNGALRGLAAHKKRSGSIAVELSLTSGETGHMNLASRARLGT